MTPSQMARLDNARARCRACGWGRGIEVEHLPCGSRFWIRFGCNTRICPKCGERYRNKKRTRFDPLKRLQKNRHDSLKFLTLTFKNVDWKTPDEARDWIRERTKMLREFFPIDHKKAARAGVANWRVRGYLAVWEITPGKSGGRWHPHLHLLIWSAFLPVAQLRRRWEAKGGGTQIRIENVRDGGKAVSYLLKYLGKPWKGIPDDLQIAALFRTRRVTSTGEFYGSKFTALSARLMESVEKFAWKLFCPCCGIPNRSALDEYVDGDLANLGRPWKPPDREWGTRRMAELTDFDAKEFRPALMVAVSWDSNFHERGDDVGEQEVSLEMGPRFREYFERDRSEPECPF